MKNYKRIGFKKQERVVTLPLIRGREGVGAGKMQCRVVCPPAYAKASAGAAPPIALPSVALAKLGGEGIRSQ
ncbi:MAG: hypothetical protein A3E36_01945 [Candidatus Andersenbacteria bacterium RIFCSPHIGHO2_12_FULL_45_11b]|uniref:Uncharacterized protein n=1 Tax=Candidatus Andersenbacteria bacterium RIFCSPHIGHO2_12_FULL_45_11b TaxID=1797282 RepID=A0A1G1X5Y8_9BACT|nr:MAG: hypothetical protein A3E36_01945 [Candidatus Andersenbacteria bacterium RIFCSPHIGHO2_12_FULL_45_11b]